MKRVLPLAIAVIVVVGLAIYMSMSVDTSSTARKDQTDFVIKDTASVGQIFIADTKGRSVKLSRTSGRWMVNDKYPAREQSAWLLLLTFHNAYIQRPVAKEAREQVNRVMAASAKKVEVYDYDGNWMKTWYVGHGTMDKKGTYMLLETPEHGRAEAPYIMDMRGFLGMLDTRFFTDEDEWRSPVILEYPDMNLTEVEVTYPDDPGASFRITYKGGNDLQLYKPGSDTPVQGFDSTLVKDYLLNFKLASFENFNSLLSPAEQDSVKMLNPFQIIKVTDATQTREIKLWTRPAPEGQTEMDPNIPAVIDRERIYANVNNGELAFAQRYVWDKFRAPIIAFIKEDDV